MPPKVQKQILFKLDSVEAF